MGTWIRVGVLLLSGSVIAGTALRFLPVITHSGLPGGDAYMAILWARVMESELAIPSYGQISILWLANDTPLSTYFTPLLHSLLFGLHSILGLPYLSLVVTSVAVVWIAILALYLLIARRGGNIEGIAALALLSLAGMRTFRYFFVTGFHFQNIFGDALVVGFLLLALRIVEAPPKTMLAGYAILLGLAPFVTLVFHQLSAVVVFLTLLLFLLVLLPTLRNYFSRRHLRYLSLLVIPLALVVIVWYTVPVFRQLFVYLTDVSEFNRQMLIPWEDYGRPLGEPLWIVGVVGAAICVFRLITDVLWRSRRNRHTLTLRERHVLLLGLSWFAATLILSRSSEIGLNLAPARFLWYTSYPLALVAVLGISSLVRMIGEFRGHSLSSTANQTTGMLVALVLVGGVLSYPAITPWLDVSPPGVVSTDSTYNGETAAVIGFLESRIQPDTIVWFDYRGWRSLLWVMTEFIPSSRISVRALPGSARFAPLSSENLDAFEGSPVGSLVVKGKSTTYGYLDESEYHIIASSPHVMILERASGLPDAPETMELQVENVGVDYFALSGSVMALLVPGLAVVIATKGRRALNRAELPGTYAKSAAISVLALSSAAAVALMLETAVLIVGLSVVIAELVVIVAGTRMWRIRSP